MASYSLQADISTLELLQKKVIQTLVHKQASLQQTRQALQQKHKIVASELATLRECYESFANQCKNEWISVYNELLAVFQRILEVYQIKVSNLQGELSNRDSRIKELQTESSHVKYSENIYEDLWNNQYPERQLFQGKRIRISDVIAVKSLGCSMSTPAHNNSLTDVIVEALSENQTEPKPERTLIQFTEQLNRNMAKQLMEQNVRESQRYWEEEVSPILSACSEKERCEMEAFQSKKMSFQMNKENRMPASQNLKMTKSTDSWSNGTSTKLNQLRRTLMQRKKSEQIF